MPIKLPIDDGRNGFLNALVETRFEWRCESICSLAPSRRPVGVHRVPNRDAKSLPHFCAVFVNFDIASVDQEPNLRMCMQLDLKALLRSPSVLHASDAVQPERNRTECGQKSAQTVEEFLNVACALIARHLEQEVSALTKFFEYSLRTTRSRLHSPPLETQTTLAHQTAPVSLLGLHPCLPSQFGVLFQLLDISLSTLRAKR